MSKADNNTSGKQYWKGIEEYEKHPSFEKLKSKEFAEELPKKYNKLTHKEYEKDLPVEKVFDEKTFDLSSDRRSFLKYFGLSVSAATLAACTETPVRKAIPYVIQPEQIRLGIANYYASTLADGGEGYSILVKTREGRPIKIEGNNESPYGRGGTCASGQASVLNLYDKGRLRGPLIDGGSVSWSDLDSEVKSTLNEIQERGGKIRILSNTINSPSTLQVVEQFKSRYEGADVQHIAYDPVSVYAIREANRRSFDREVLPSYNLEDAKMIVGFAADFLGTWISPVDFTKQYMKNRKIRGNETDMSYHVQFETNLSITGSNADRRVTLKPSQYGKALTALYNKIAAKAGVNRIDGEQFELAGNTIEVTAGELWKNRGKSLLLCGSNDVNHQILVNGINKMLGNIGKTVDLDNPSYQKAGNDAQVQSLITEAENGEVDALLILGANPVYQHPAGTRLREAMDNIALTLSTADRLDETAQHTRFVAPDHHFLEAWNDFQPKSNVYTLSQPTISPIFNTRNVSESLLRWADDDREYYEVIRKNWEENMFPRQDEKDRFDFFWVKVVHDGFFAVEKSEASDHEFRADINEAARGALAGSNENGLEICLYEKAGLRDGKHANNPWLQELPDPISKVCWDNYACLSPKFAKENNIKEEDVIRIESGDYAVELPVLLQPGQTYGTIGVALGYGREMDEQAAKVANGIGKNVFPFARVQDGTIRMDQSGIEIENTGNHYRLAKTQTHHNLEGRNIDILRETTIQDIKKNPETAGIEKPYPSHTLYKEWEYNGHHWGMGIDLSACTGCGSCVIACQAENNVPVVGKEEVLRRREMHWIRIDRYYSGDPENPEVLTQPMLCQQCDQAPCENVCPVLAITHSSEGLNQQTYNRCVGTRYCANNCPYKVRRFNWFNYVNSDKFDYNMNNQLGRMALNPDVTVRSRGVMEKCTFCVQTIQEKKLNAKKENRGLRDGEIKTACQSACPADAIVFGDMNDENSEVRKMMDEKRAYEVLEIIGVESSIRYLPKVTNKKHEEA